MFIRLIFILTTLFFLSGCDDMAKWAYNAGLSAEKSRAGLIDKNITTSDGIDWVYLESENTEDLPVVMLIHGFGADSSNWVRFVNELEGEYHFVVPDLPGHGETTRNTQLDYNVTMQAARIVTLADALGIEKFHVAGSSMGGAISVALALQASDRLLSVGLVDAAGVTLVTPEFLALIEGNGNPLIPHKAEDMFVTMDWAMADAPWMPDFFVTQMGKIKAENADVAEKVHADVNGKMELRDRLKEIQTPTLIVWGKEDRLLGVDNVPVFDKEIPNSKAVILDGIGHLPMAEAPGKTADIFRAFWKDVAANALVEDKSK